MEPLRLRPRDLRGARLPALSSDLRYGVGFGAVGHSLSLISSWMVIAAGSWRTRL
jgi:hypothetical protein